MSSWWPASIQRAAKRSLRHVPLLHRPADLRLGDRPRHHDRRRAGDPWPAGQPVSQHRPAGRADLGDLSGSVRPDGAGHRGAGDRAAAQWPRRPSLHLLRQQRGWQHPDHCHLRPGHQSGHRPGAGAEQAAAGHPHAARRGAAARRPGREVPGQLHHDRGAGLGRRPHEQRRPCRLHHVQPAGSDCPGSRRRRLPAVRVAVCHAHLARPGEAQQLSAHPIGRAGCDPGTKRADLVRPARRSARASGRAAQCRPWSASSG